MSYTENEQPRGIAVYCGASVGAQLGYKLAAESVGRAIAQASRPLIYGGGNVGLMGFVSTSALEAGGSVVGVIPSAMTSIEGQSIEGVSSALSAVGGGVRNSDKMETIVVETMHSRKVEMAKRSAAFVGLPGGFGSFEEIFEVTTWTQLGIHNKPVIILNVLSFYDPLKALIQNAVKEGFISPKKADLMTFVDEPADGNWGKAALEAIEAWVPVPEGQALFKWGSGLEKC